VLAAAAGVRVAVSPPETTRICNDKLATCHVLSKHGISAASTYLPAELPAALSFPLFIKPRVGRGGVAAYPVRSARELGYWATGQQLDPALRGMSVPLLDRKGVCKGAVRSC